MVYKYNKPVGLHTKQNLLWGKRINASIMTLVRCIRILYLDWYILSCPNSLFSPVMSTVQYSYSQIMKIPLLTVHSLQLRFLNFDPLWIQWTRLHANHCLIQRERATRYAQVKYYYLIKCIDHKKGRLHTRCNPISTSN